jgi:hypothetical protein
MLQFLFLAFLHCTFATEVMFPMLLPIGAKNRITHEGYDQLKFGMSLKEVEKTLGGLLEIMARARGKSSNTGGSRLRATQFALTLKRKGGSHKILQSQFVSTKTAG